MKSKHFSYFRVLEALREPGCALCRLGGTAANRFLDSLLYEYVNDTGMRRMLVEAHGFCPNHSNALVARHDALGTSILYKAILNHLQAELETVTPEAREGWGSKLREQLGGARGASDRLAAHEGCPACTQRDDAVLRALAIVAEHEGDAELAAALAASDGFCLPHLRMALPQLSGRALAQLLARQRAVWQALDGELAEAIRKHDFRFRDEAFGDEEDSWRRAVEAVAGAPGLF
jgi:hypothetical protein